MIAPESLLNLSPVGAIYVLPIGWPISFNAYKDRQQRTTKKGRVWRDMVAAKIWDQCKGQPEPLIGKVSIYWELWEPQDNRDRDLDNFTGKHILDAIVKAGVIEDDNTRTVVRLVREYRGKCPGGHLIVTAMEV